MTRRAQAGAPLAARLQLLAAAALFSTGGAAIKATTLTGWQVAGCRSALAALAVAVMLPRSRRWPRPRMLAVAAAYAATLLLFVLANKLTTAASTIFLQATAPLYILLLSPALLGERIGRRDLAYMAAMAAGLGLLFVDLAPASATAPRPLLGNALGALSGVTWAFTLMGMRWLQRGGGARERGTGGAAGVAGAGGEGGPGGAGGVGKEPAAPEEAGSGPVALLWGNVLAAAIALPMALLAGSPPGTAQTAGIGRLTDWLILGYLGVFQIALAYVFLTRGIARVQALETSLLLLLEPVLNPVWAWLVHGERPRGWALAGGAVILLGTLIKAWIDSRPPGPVVPVPS